MDWFNVIIAEDTDGYLACRGFSESGKPKQKSIEHWFNLSNPDIFKQIESFIWDCDRKGMAAYIIPSIMPWNKAGKDDVASCQVVLIDIDSGDISAKLDKAIFFMGEPTMVVASGGMTPEGQAKLHVYWQLSEPAESKEEIAILSDVRRRLALLVGADPALKTLSQPIRVPGSVHHKADPTLVNVVSVSKRQVHLNFVNDELPQQGDPTPEHKLEEHSGPVVITEGNRNVRTTGVAGGAIGRVYKGEISFEDAKRYVNEFNMNCNVPPLPQDEVDTIFNSIHKREQKKPVVVVVDKKDAVVDDTPDDYQKDRYNVAINNMENARIALKDKALRFNEFSQIDEICLGGEWQKFDDNICLQLTAFMQRNKGLSRMSDANVHKAVRIESLKNSYHPVKNYLNHCYENYQPNYELLDKFFPIIFGSEETEYSRRIAHVLFGSMVARVFEPGCKVDTVIIAEGKQGAGKSTAWDYLANTWFSDRMPELDSKDSLLQMLGKWLIEFGELTSIRKSDIETAKRFITSRVDTYRPPFGRTTIDVPRQTVFVGSTNQRYYLNDATGSRRFLPIKCEKVDIETLKKIREIIFCTAMHLYKQGNPYWVTQEWEELAKIEQEQRFSVDAWEYWIEKYLTHEPKRTPQLSWSPRMEPLHQVQTSTILLDALDVQIVHQTPNAQTKVVEILERLGFVPRNDTKFEGAKGKRCRYYARFANISER